MEELAHKRRTAPVQLPCEVALRHLQGLATAPMVELFAAAALHRAPQDTRGRPWAPGQQGGGAGRCVREHSRTEAVAVGRVGTSPRGATADHHQLPVATRQHGAGEVLTVRAARKRRRLLLTGCCRFCGGVVSSQEAQCSRTTVRDSVLENRLVADHCVGRFRREHQTAQVSADGKRGPEGSGSGSPALRNSRGSAGSRTRSN